MEETTENKLERLLKKFLGKFAREIKVEKKPESPYSAKFVVSLENLNHEIDIGDDYKRFIEELEEMEENEELEINTYGIYNCIRTLYPDTFMIIDEDESYESLEEIVMEIEIYDEDGLKKFERLIDKFLILSI